MLPSLLRSFPLQIICMTSMPPRMTRAQRIFVEIGVCGVPSMPLPSSVYWPVIALRRAGVFRDEHGVEGVGCDVMVEGGVADDVHRIAAFLYGFHLFA